MQISKFKNIYSRIAAQTELYVELNDIKNGKYKDIITKCRNYTANSDYDSYKNLKKKLSAVTFCGTFVNGRKLENLISYNKIIILDIDHLQKSNVSSVKEIIQNDNYTLSVWLSPSGEGLKALVRIESNPEEHKLSFDSLKDYYFTKYEIELDQSGSDITRLCLSSWDKDLYLNKIAKIYKEKKVLSPLPNNNIKKVITNKSLNKSAYATEGLNLTENKKMLSLIIKYLKRKNLSITNNYYEWFRVAIAIATSFSYDLGEKYYLRLCELDRENHDEFASKNILKYSYNNRNLDLASGITFGTIVYYAKEKGFITKKDKLKNQ